MTGDEADEVLGIIREIGPVILSTSLNAASGAGVSLRRVVGMMLVDPNMLHQSTFSFAIAISLDLARHAGATLVTMDRVRKAALAMTPSKLPGILAVNIIIRLTLATEARIIAFMQFRSREEVERIATAVNVAFQQSEEVAADDLDAATYMALVSLHGEVVKHLADRGRQLPRVIPYHYAMVMPALRMAQQAYFSAERYHELIDENNIVHPAFMPMDGKMLAV